MKNNARATVDIGNGGAKLIVRRIMKLKAALVMAALNVWTRGNCKDVEQ